MYKNVIQHIFCFALLNAYNIFEIKNIMIFFKMLKNNFLLSVVYGVLFLGVTWAIVSSQFRSWSDSLVFSYPDVRIEFSGEELPLGWSNWYYNKQRFDKEFLQMSNNLYQFYLYVKRYPLYIPYIKKKLQEAWIPNDFKYMPIAESALRNDVVSSAGAAGIWQFMPETAKRLGLRVDEFVDERYHFEKATEAATEYIQELHERFNNWTLVAAAYNRWENWLSRDMESQSVDNYYDLYLNEETSRYVFRIMSIKYVMYSYFEKKDLIDKIIWWVYKKPITKIVRVWKIDNIALWAQENDYNYKDIRVLNRWIIGDSLPEGEWEISVLDES